MAYDTLPWQASSLSVARATEILTRLDERLSRSPVGEGWIQRMHFHDATAALWLEGELVHLEDLVLHDAHMDIRTPTHELTRAHTVLRARRQILGAKVGWALSREGLMQLTHRAPSATASGSADDVAKGLAPEEPGSERSRIGELDDVETGDATPHAAEDGLDFTHIDAVLDRTARLLDGETLAPRAPIRPAARDPLVYDLDWNEEERLAEWQIALVDTENLPTVARAAVLLDAWHSIEVLQLGSWLGPLLVAELMRQSGLCAKHLDCLAMGL
ncbi:MAG: RHE_PE00001 family protein, partial [Rhizobiaceae bacterium]